MTRWQTSEGVERLERARFRPFHRKSSEEQWFVSSRELTDHEAQESRILEIPCVEGETPREAEAHEGRGSSLVLEQGHLQGARP
jgi:hypothetical protein